MASVDLSDRSILVVEDLTLISKLLDHNSLTSDHSHHFFLLTRDILLHHREFLRGDTVRDQGLLDVSVRQDLSNKSLLVSEGKARALVGVIGIKDDSRRLGLSG